MIEAAIHGLYQAALDREDRGAALQKLLMWFGARAGGLCFDPGLRAPRSLTLIELTPTELQFLNGTDDGTDPLTPAPRPDADQGAHSDNRIVRILCPQRQDGPALGMEVANEGQSSSVRLVLAAFGDLPAAEAVAQRLRHLHPHLAHALSVYRLTVESRINADNLNAMLQLRGEPAFLLAPAGEVLHMNAAAHDATREMLGLTLTRDRVLRFKYQADNQALQAALRSLVASSGAHANTPRADTARLLRVRGIPSDEEHCEFVLRLITTSFGPRVLALMRSRRYAPTLSVPALRQAFGLTDMEATLALALANNQRLQEFAEAQHIEITTARWHLQNTFRKTEVTSQAQLVRLLLALDSL